ncbi:MAG: hypothetical protein RL701_5974 [Pseudomonadota bacterium]|jgi:predicted enzyme related to lactoylglutathione lyase
MPHIDKPNAGTIVWTELATPDLGRARAFYSELLGWSFTGGDDPRTGHYTMAQIAGRDVAGLRPRGPNESAPAAWLVYFGTDSVDETAAKVSAAGGQVAVPAMDVMDFGRMAVCADPAGAVFGLWQGKQHLGARIVNDPGATAWHEVYSRDAQKALAFYTQVFGLEARKLDAPGIEYWSLHKGDLTVGGTMQMSDQFPKEVPSHWNSYFAVSDTDAATRKLEQLGGKVFQPAFDTAYGRMSAVADPLGVGFCLIKPKS